MGGIRIGQPLPEPLRKSVVLGKDGTTVVLESVLKAQPTALLFIRHFGCLGCSVHMADLAPRMEEVHRLGLDVVLVGNGESRFIEGFLQRFGLNERQVTVVTDPTLKTHKAAMLKRSFWGTLGPKGIWDQIRALIGGHRQNNIQGDNWQQGGAILMDTDGSVVYYHRNDTVSDHARTNVLVDTIYKLLLKQDPLYS